MSEGSEYSALMDDYSVAGGFSITRDHVMEECYWEEKKPVFQSLTGQLSGTGESSNPSAKVESPSAKVEFHYPRLKRRNVFNHWAFVATVFGLVVICSHVLLIVWEKGDFMPLYSYPLAAVSGVFTLLFGTILFTYTIYYFENLQFNDRTPGLTEGWVSAQTVRFRNQLGDHYVGKPSIYLATPSRYQYITSWLRRIFLSEGSRPGNVNTGLYCFRLTYQVSWFIIWALQTRKWYRLDPWQYWDFYALYSRDSFTPALNEWFSWIFEADAVVRLATYLLTGEKVLKQPAFYVDNFFTSPFLLLLKSVVWAVPELRQWFKVNYEGIPFQQVYFQYLGFGRLLVFLRNIDTHSMPFTRANSRLGTVISLIISLVTTLFLGAASTFVVDAAEMDDPTKPQTIPGYIYFIVITIMTVGYGDYVPKTSLAKLIVIILMIFTWTFAPAKVIAITSLSSVDPESLGQLPKPESKRDREMRRQLEMQSANLLSRETASCSDNMLTIRFRQRRLMTSIWRARTSTPLLVAIANISSFTLESFIPEFVASWSLQPLARLTSRRLLDAKGDTTWTSNSTRRLAQVVSLTNFILITSLPIVSSQLHECCDELYRRLGIRLAIVQDPIVSFQGWDRPEFTPLARQMVARATDLVVLPPDHPQSGAKCSLNKLLPAISSVRGSVADVSVAINHSGDIQGGLRMRIGHVTDLASLTQSLMALCLSKVPGIHGLVGLLCARASFEQPWLVESILREVSDELDTDIFCALADVVVDTPEGPAEIREQAREEVSLIKQGMLCAAGQVLTLVDLLPSRLGSLSYRQLTDWLNRSFNILVVSLALQIDGKEDFYFTPREVDLSLSGIESELLEALPTKMGFCNTNESSMLSVTTVDEYIRMDCSISAKPEAGRPFHLSLLVVASYHAVDEFMVEVLAQPPMLGVGSREFASIHGARQERLTPYLKEKERDNQRANVMIKRNGGSFVLTANRLSVVLLEPPTSNDDGPFSMSRKTLNYYEPTMTIGLLNWPTDPIRMFEQMVVEQHLRVVIFGDSIPGEIVSWFFSDESVSKRLSNSSFQLVIVRRFIDSQAIEWSGLSNESTIGVMVARTIPKAVGIENLKSSLLREDSNQPELKTWRQPPLDPLEFALLSDEGRRDVHLELVTDEPSVHPVHRVSLVDRILPSLRRARETLSGKHLSKQQLYGMCLRGGLFRRTVVDPVKFVQFLAQDKRICYLPIHRKYAGRSIGHLWAYHWRNKRTILALHVRPPLAARTDVKPSYIWVINPPAVWCLPALKDDEDDRLPIGFVLIVEMTQGDSVLTHKWT